MNPILVKQKLLELGATEEEIIQNLVYLLYNQADDKYELIRDPDKLLIKNVN